MRAIIYYFLVLSCILFVGCKKFIQIDPPKTKLVTQSVFTSDAGANAAMTGIYSNCMNSSNGFLNGAITLYAGLSADELDNYATASPQGEFYKNTITVSNGLNERLWDDGFNIIYATNAVIEGVQASTGLSAAVARQVTGEALFIRAYCNFLLAGLYGDIPVVRTTNYQINTTVARTPVAAVYDSIIADLTKAQALLPVDYTASGGEKTRPNQWAATALLSKLYLYKGDWASAEKAAGSLIDGSGLRLENDLNKVFLKNSSEAIFQLIPVKSSVNTDEGASFILLAQPDNVALTSSLVNSFGAGDARKTKWINSFITGSTTYYYTFKYKVKSGSTITEYYTVQRLAEQYLIRAEARAQLNNIDGAVADLNTIRNRAGLNTLPNTLTMQQCLLAIEQERRAELFCEWGHRWFDIKRTNRAGAVFGPAKAPNWTTTDQLYPIPPRQLLNDKNTLQNPGY